MPDNTGSGIIQEYDIVVIGSGPAGATTALFAAKNGLKVLLADKKQELGAPIQCSGAVSHNALENADVFPSPEFIQEAIYGFAIYNATGEKKVIDYRKIKPDEYGSAEGCKPLGYVVDRRRFDRYLATQAERAGVTIWLKTEASGYRVLENGSCEVDLIKFNEPITVKAKVVVGADGVQSQVGKWAGIKTHIKLSELASCLQFVVDGVETSGLLEIVTGHEWAPGGYAWVFPKGHGYAEIGLGITKTMCTNNAQQYLDHFLKDSFFKDRFKNCKILEIQGGGVPLAAPLKTQYADNLILVGDAARHVNSITGGGIHTALSGGKIAGEFLSALILNGDAPTADNLKGYHDNWLKAMGNNMWKLYRVKRKIFDTADVLQRDEQLYATMSNYFSPDSEYKKI
ncbi:geranylgeranyl reductase family protein [Ferruginibacter sp. SUN106]|uniref:geranylgeranyl reductase family protein n=1 Tax=Ferruginibacter sp. SUN106 TaxID=2978348 RepID=UPI003D3688AD